VNEIRWLTEEIRGKRFPSVGNISVIFSKFGNFSANFKQIRQFTEEIRGDLSPSLGFTSVIVGTL